MMLAVAAAVLPATQAHGAVTPADGQLAYDAGDYSDAKRIWTALAEAGDPDAAMDLGRLYDLGRGAPQDPALAYRWYRRAAQAGLPAAAFNVAVMHDAGRGTTHDRAAAALWYAKAAALGHGRAAFNLAQMYAAGDGVPRNPEVAAAWFREAAQAGLPAAAGRAAALGPGPAATATRNAVPDKPLPVIPVEPAGVIGADGGVRPSSLALVWIAPAQTAPVSFFVEVVLLSPDPPQPVVARYVDVSSAAVSLSPARYAWRVSTVGKHGRHYTPSGWTSFTIAAAAAN